MVIDYEAAWHELQSFIASKTQHGREGLLVEMSRLTDDHRVVAGELSRLLRLHGVEVERTRRLSAEPDRDVAGDFSPGPSSGGDTANPGHHDHIGGHDGRSNGSPRAAAGR